MSDDTLLKRMRELRRKAEWLNQTVVEDHRVFLKRANRLTFFRRLSEPKTAVGVSPTCTALMALALSKSYANFYKPKSMADLPDAVASGLSDSEVQERAAFGLPKEDLSKLMKAAIGSLLNAEWDTGALDANNAFTTSLVLRAAGFVLRAGYIAKHELVSLKRACRDLEWVAERQPPHETADGKQPQQEIADEKRARREITVDFREFHDSNVTQIAQRVAEHFPSSLGVQKYPPSPTIAYWLLDAVRLLDIDLGSDLSRRILDWAARELTRQVSLVSASDDARMDPVAMAMAACLCRLLRRMAATCDGMRLALAGEMPTNGRDALEFPTDTELRSAILLFLKKQTPTGVWEKYFPLFHYPGAGPNHCWHFEVLEAVLNEFPETVQQASALEKLGRSVAWLEGNRLFWRGPKDEFMGWNSGGDIHALRAGEPESWPTGVAHMFLWRLRQALGIQIQKRILLNYRERVQWFAKPDPEKWKEYLDCRLPHGQNGRETVTAVLDVEILKPTEEAINEYSGAGPTARKPIGPDFCLKKRKARSALLFGPPGTSKTSLEHSRRQDLSQDVVGDILNWMSR
jgi:hypothetical protein